MSQTSSNEIIPPPGLQEATKNSTYAWQGDLEQLFRNAKDRFPDVVWEVGVDENDMVVKDVVEAVDEVWGHKAIVYARAPPSFQTRYFSFRQPLATFPVGEYPDESESINPRTRTPSPSPSTTTIATATSIPQQQPSTTSLLRLTSSINSNLFSNELEYLYTGKGFGEAFEFLFDASEPSRDRFRGVEDEDDQDDHPDPEALRIDKLRKDLVFMWRSRLYSDVRIALTGNFSSSSTTNDNTTTAIFSSHRFILVSRSPYFHTALLSWPSELPQGSSSEPPILNLPSPPFTPASLHFTLGFMYTGTLIFSHRSYDLSTAFAIMRASMYLSIPSLHDEIQARIIQEMLHGLFHAFIPFEEYDRLTGGKWGTGGCRCRQCARRVPRVLEFAIADDVRNRPLERGARRALVGHFGEGWVHQEFASLPVKIRESTLKGLAKRTTPLNIFPLLFAAEHALGKLGVVIEPWGDISKDMILNARKTIDEVLCKESEACFNSDEWMELMEADGVRFEDGEKVEWSMAAILRGVKDAYAACLYQTLVSSILLRPHPTDVNAPLLPAISHVRVQVEQTRLELLRWIGKRWLAIRQERGFDPLEGWALKEISDHIEVPIEDLLNPTHTSHSKISPKRQQPTTTTNLLRPTSNHPHTSKVDAESDIASSMRVSVLSRSLPMRQTSTSTTGTTSFRDRDNGLSSSASSVRNTARTSSDSYASAMSGNTLRQLQSDGGMSPAKMIIKETRASNGSGRTVELKDRPDSKLTPSVLRTRSPSLIQPSVLEPEEEEPTEEGEDEEAGGGGEAGERESSQYDDDIDGEEDSTHTQPIKKVLITRASLASVTSRSSLSSLSSMRPKSSASSVRSQTTLRKSVTSTVASNSNSSRSRLNVNPTKTPTSPAPRPIRTYRISTTNNTRPTSSQSSVADSTATYRTASTGLRSSPTTGSRRTSGASTISMRTPNGGDKSKSSSPVNERTRKISGASVNSVASNAGSLKAPSRVRTTSTGKKPIGGASGGATPPVPVVDPKKLSPVPRPGSIHSSVSGGSTSTGSNSTSRKVVRKVVLKKKSSGDVDRNSSSPLSAEPSVKEPEVEVEVEAKKEGMEKGVEKEEMDVDMEDVKEEVKEEAKKGEKPFVGEDIDVDPLPDTTSSTITIKPQDRPSIDPIPVTATSNMVSEHKKSSSSASTSSSIATLKRKGSSDTIKTVKSAPPAPIIIDAPLIKQLPPTPVSQPSSPWQDRQLPLLQHQTSNLKPPVPKTSPPDFKVVPQGTTLEIGIPCIIASKRKRFKAYARYIGEVEGETGAWVGVEVPMPFGDSFVPNDDKVQGDDRQWNDGSWGGIRYFEIRGMGGSEWDYGGGTNEDRASRRRRVDGGSGIGIGGGGGWGDKGLLKREGDQFSIASASEMRRKKVRSVSPAVSDMSGVESRGLFVRPQQVLYVVGAVGADL